jgi:outer membrane protein OmpA-like peptidoglycan-associated protein
MDSKRNQSVKEYLISKGVSPTRLKSEGKGSLNPNLEVKDTDEEDLKLAKNRRVTFSVQ